MAELDRTKTGPLVRVAGAALYGDRWPTPLAVALGRPTAEVWDWAEALRPMPMAALLDLRALLMERWDDPGAAEARAAVHLIDELL